MLWGASNEGVPSLPERSFYRKLNIIIFAAHQCDKDQPKMAFFFFFPLELGSVFDCLIFRDNYIGKHGMLPENKGRRSMVFYSAK